MRQFLGAVASIGIFASAPALAAASDQHFRPIAPDEQINIRPDRAYLLMRCLPDPKGRCGLPLLLRVPTPAENKQFHDAKLAAWRKKGPKAGPFEAFPFALKGMENLYIPEFKRPLAQDATANAFLFEADPGEYVVYGVGNKYSMMMCFCLGTVGVTAKAGQIADVGTFIYGRTSEPSPQPELAEVTNLGVAFNMDFPLISMALRPARTSDLVPASIRHLPRADAAHFAVGPYYEPAARGVNRLAPILNVLAYERGKVIDVRTGKALEGR